MSAVLFGRSELASCSEGSVFSVQLRYANNSNYKNDSLIRKEAFVSQAVLDELKRIIEDSEVSHALKPALVRSTEANKDTFARDNTQVLLILTSQ